jgi:isopenicillin N synthase-like dioxygenase
MANATGFTEIPIVDISGLGGNDAAKARVAEALGRAAREVGFLYVTGHGIPDDLVAGLLDATKRFFAQPIDEKMKVYIGRSCNHRGYVPEGEEELYPGSRDKKEAYDLSIDLPADDPDYLAGNPMLGPNQWPSLPGFREAVGAYYDAAFAVCRSLLGGFASALGEDPATFDRLVTKPPSQLRLIHYPFDPSLRDASGIGAHTDYELFTLLLGTAPGLEVMNGDSVWIDAPPVPGAFVVNIGDMLEILSNGAFVATSHRVRKVQEERYSFPLFFTVDYHTRIAPLPRFVVDGAPERPALVAGEHVFAQTAQSFAYLKERLARGEISLPDSSRPMHSFGRDVLTAAR